MDTVTVARESLVSLKTEKPDGYEHLKRLQQVMPHMRFLVEDWERKEIQYCQFQPFLDAGFRFITDEQKMCRFPYAASLDSYGFASGEKQWGGYYSIQYACVHDKNKNGILYVGDIPEFALDRVAQANEICRGLEKYYAQITVHSVFPLPHIITKPKYSNLTQVDPVLVFWPFNRPDFLVQGNKITSHQLNLGIILAVWDNDKELEL